MTLPDLLHDLSRTESVRARADLAWADGRRRRVRVRAQALVAAAAVLGLLALVAPGLPAPVPTFARSSETVVDGYPERIGRQWWVRALPERPGPLAALLAEEFEWYGVRADGHRWRLPEVSHRTALWPALSDDGRLLAYLEQESGPYVVRDLLTGERIEFPGVVEPAGADLESGILYGQAPALFSPDGTRLLLPGGAAVLDLRSRSVQLLRAQERLAATLGVPAGWAGEDRIVWLRDGGQPAAAPPVELRARTTDLRGRTTADVALVGTTGLLVSQWSGVVQVEDGLLAVVPDDFYARDDLVRRFRLADGSAVGEPVPVDVGTPCAGVWGADGSLVVPPGGEGVAVATEVLPTGTRTLTVAPPDDSWRCLVWARAAVDGEPHGGGLLGLRGAWWAWWWRELLLAAVLVPLAAMGAARLWRLPRRERPGTARPAPDWYS